MIFNIIKKNKNYIDLPYNNTPTYIGDWDETGEFLHSHFYASYAFHEALGIVAAGSPLHPHIEHTLGFDFNLIEAIVAVYLPSTVLLILLAIAKAALVMNVFMGITKLWREGDHH